LFCIVSEGHELAGRKQISAAEMIRYPLIGIDRRRSGFVNVFLISAPQSEHS
jgi:hypothetical protein